MYTNKTPNLELPQWQLDDYLQPIADLNPAFAKLDSSVSETNTKLAEALQKVQELTQQVTEDMAAIEQAKKDIQKNATDITDINQVLNGVKLKEAEVDAALKQIGLNVTKLFNNDLNIVKDLTALVNAETTRAKAQEEIIDTKATSAAVAAADAQNLAETSKSFAEEAKNSAAEAARSASDSATQATQAQETAESVKQDFETNVRPQVQEAKDAALAAQQSAEAANRQATLSAGYASNAARDAQTATETATSADEKATEALEKATQAQTDAAQAKTDTQTASEQATQAATSASTAETKATEAAASANTAEENATAAAADAESAKQDAASAKAEADAAKLSADAAAQSAASADESAGTAATTSADALLKAETVETEFNQLKDTEWPSYKQGIDQSIEQLREDTVNKSYVEENFLSKTVAGAQYVNDLVIVGEDSNGVGVYPEGKIVIASANAAKDPHTYGPDGFYNVYNVEQNLYTLGNFKVASPINDNDAATKGYVDSHTAKLKSVFLDVCTINDNIKITFLRASISELVGGLLITQAMNDSSQPVMIYLTFDSESISGFLIDNDGTKYEAFGYNIITVNDDNITFKNPFTATPLQYGVHTVDTGMLLFYE